MDWFSLFVLMCVICMVAMIPMMLLGRGRWMPMHFMHGGWPDDSRETARDILDRRYASGEITEERYQAILADLAAHGARE